MIKKEMMKRNVSKSKEFREKEEILRENLRLKNERELIGDYIILLEEKLYCDVTFMVDEVEFPAHSAILYARAPKFSNHFLPKLLVPTAMQSSINIQNIKPEEFSVFLRSIYTENDFQDYCKTEYPWTEKVSWSFLDNNKSPLVQNKRHDFEDSLDEHEDQNDLDHANNCSDQTDGVNGDENSNSTFIQVENSSLEGCCRIGQDLITLVDDSKSSDITFILREQEKVKAHRAILCARSSYFSTMLFGDWSEKRATEIPLLGVSQQAFYIVLCFLYGGITRIPLEITDICEVMYLADMYGLEGLKEVVECELKLVKCHLFHKPCSLCVTGVVECLEVSEVFNLAEFKNLCLRWIAKYFDRVCSTKRFASISPKLQDESFSTIQASMNQLNVIDLLSRGDKVESSTPRIKWAEPILVFFSMLIDSCLSFIAANFPVIASQSLFRDMMKGVGWSTPMLEKVFMSVWDTLTIENCCEQLKVATRLRNTIKVTGDDDEEEHFSEEICNLVERLLTKCQNFIVSNLHRVTHTDGWSSLSPRTQTEIRKSKGGMFVDVGLPSQANKTFKGLQSSKRPSNSLRPTSKKLDTNPTKLRKQLDSRTSTHLTREQKPRSARPAAQGCSRQSAASGRSGSASNKRPVSAPTSLRDSRPTLPSSRPPRAGVRDGVNRGQHPGISGASNGPRSLKESSRNTSSTLQKTKGNTTKSNANSSNASKTLNTTASASNSTSVASSTANFRTTRNSSEKLATTWRSDSNLSQNKKIHDSKSRRSYPDISQLKLSTENTVKKKPSHLDVTASVSSAQLKLSNENTVKKKPSRLDVTVSSARKVTKSKTKESKSSVACQEGKSSYLKNQDTSETEECRKSRNENEEPSIKLVHDPISSTNPMPSNETMQSEGSAGQYVEDGISKLKSENESTKNQEDSGSEDTNTIETAEEVIQLKDSNQAVCTSNVEAISEVSLEEVHQPFLAVQQQCSPEANVGVVNEELTTRSLNTKVQPSSESESNADEN